MDGGIGKRALASAALVSAAALICAGQASADQTDDAFIVALQRGGIALKDRDAAIAMGHTVCVGLAKGATAISMVMTFMTNADLSPTEAGHVVGVSVAAYCPQYRGVLDDPVWWPGSLYPAIK